MLYAIALNLSTEQYNQLCCTAVLLKYDKRRSISGQQSHQLSLG